MSLFSCSVPVSNKRKRRPSCFSMCAQRNRYQRYLWQSCPMTDAPKWGRPAFSARSSYILKIAFCVVFSAKGSVAIYCHASFLVEVPVVTPGLDR